MANETNTPDSTEPKVGIILDDAERFQLAQAIYNTVTGKTEKLSRSYSKNYMIRYADINQLHAKCVQACTQWNVLQKSSSITVHHIDDNKEQFSSMDRFKIYDVSKTAPVESVVYEFNILIALPKISKPQNYKIVVRCISRIGMLKKMEDEEGPMPFGRFFGASPILVEIEYVDYVVARNLLSMLDSWAAEVEHTATWVVAKRFQDYSHWIEHIFQTVIIIVAVYAFGKATETYLTASSTPPVIIKWALYMAGSVWVLAIIAKLIGGAVENSIDRIIQLSAISLNKGDERLIEAYSKRNTWKTIQAVIGTMIVIVQGIAIKYLITVFTRFF
jgi:hypothetical protein